MPLWRKQGTATDSRKLGDESELQAAAYLQKQGLKLLTRNYRCRRGEIDLIMQDGNFLVFVEVRYRKNDKYGSAAESVTRQKQERLIITADHYLQNEKQGADMPCRFDVLTLSNQQQTKIHWIKNAFQN